MVECKTRSPPKKSDAVSATLLNILLDLLDTIKDITESRDGHLYMMVNNKLYRFFRGHCTAYPTGWNPGPGTIPVAFAAETKTVFISNSGIDKSVFKYGLGRKKDADVDKILCIPIMDPKEVVFAVLELTRYSNDPPYDEEETNMAATICSWASSTIYRNSSKSLINKDDNLLIDSISFIEKYVSGNMDFTTYLVETMEYIQKSIGADGVIYSELLSVDPYIVIDYYKRNEESPHLERSSQKRCLNESDEEVLYCLKTGDVYRRTELSTSNEQTNIQQDGTEPVIFYESVLYCPIFELKKPAGVAMFWKKSPVSGFNWYDELFSSNAVANLIIAYNIHRLSERNFMKGLMTTNIFNMVINQLKASKYDYDFIKEMLKSPPEFPENFFKFVYYPKEDETKLNLITNCMNMFRVVLGDRFLHMNPRLGEFIIMVANNYRNMFYHNFLHAFTTMHAMFNIIIRNKDKIYPLEVVSLLIATICHDMDHAGVSNAHLKLVDSYMWQLYEEPPTLEHHHSFFAHYLIQHCQLFDYMKQEKYKQILNSVREHILATDLTNHFKVIADIYEMMSEKGFQWGNPDHRERFKCILMTTCDLAGSFKAPQDAVQITCNLYGEFYAQGDKEKKRGVTPLLAMDRSMTDIIPQGQVTFIAMICSPCFEVVKEILPNCDEIIVSTQRLVDYWKKMAEKKPNERNLVIPDSPNK